METITFKAAYYEITDKSFICPSNDVYVGETVMALVPLAKIDPRRIYAFVVTHERGTQTVTRKFLKYRGSITIRLPQLLLETANQLKARKIKAMMEKLAELYEDVTPKACEDYEEK